MKQPTFKEIKENYKNYLLLTREKDLCFIARDDFDGLICYNKDCNGIIDICDDLYHSEFEDLQRYDVIAIKRFDNEIEPISAVINNHIPDEWDWSEEDDVLEMTMDEVCKALGKNIKIVKE